jgi:hypothetical protein
MKPTFIALKTDGKLNYAINSQDIKVVTIHNESGQVTVLTSHNTVKAKLTTHAITKLRKELSDRYHVVKVRPTSVGIDKTRNATHALLYVQDVDKTHIIFPKALNTVQLNGTKIEASVYGGDTFSIEATNALKDFENLKEAKELLNLVALN